MTIKKNEWLNFEKKRWERSENLMKKENLNLSVYIEEKMFT